MPYDSDVDEAVCIVNGINNSIIADSDSPERILACKFLHPAGRGFAGRDSIFLSIRNATVLPRLSSSLRADRAKETE